MTEQDKMKSQSASIEIYTEKDLEQFRLKFRNEALRACEEAEIRGFEKGCASKLAELKRVEDDAKRWQCIAEAVGVGENELNQHQKPIMLIKYIMELVYREMRTQFNVFDASSAVDNCGSGVIRTEKAIDIMKNVLLSITKRLEASMPLIVLLSGEETGRAVDEAGLAGKRDDMTLTPAFAHTVPTVTSRHHFPGPGPAPTPTPGPGPGFSSGSSDLSPMLIGMKWRPSNVMYPFLPPLRLLISADIESSRVVASSGTFSSGHTCYSIRHSLRLNKDSLQSVWRRAVPAASLLLVELSDDGVQEHRYKEFEVLSSALRKNFPDSIFPPLPPKEAAGTNSSAVQAATLSVLDRESKDKALGINEPRRRQLTLWIKYVSLHHSLQLSPDFLSFLCRPQEARRLLSRLQEIDVGIGFSTAGRAGAGRRRMHSAYMNTVLLSEMLSSTGVDNNVVYEGMGFSRELEPGSSTSSSSSSSAGSAAAGMKMVGSFVGSHVKCSGIYNTVSQQSPPVISVSGVSSVSNPHTNGSGSGSSSGNHVGAEKPTVQGYTDVARNIAQRQLHTAIRDFDQLEPHLAAAVECSKYWFHALEAQADAWKGLVATLPGIMAVESCNYCCSGGTSPFRIREPGVNRNGSNGSNGNENGGSHVCVRETLLWEVLYVTLRDSVLPSLEAAYSVVNTRFYEPHFYCGNLCLSQARASIAATKGLPVGTDEHVDASLKTAQEWGIFRLIRHSLLMEYEQDAVGALMCEKQKQLTAWSLALSDMTSGQPMTIPNPNAAEGVEDESHTSATASAAVATAAESARKKAQKPKLGHGCSGLSLPSTDSLKGAVDDEIRGLDEHVARLRREFEDCKRRSSLGQGSAGAGSEAVWGEGHGHGGSVSVSISVSSGFDQAHNHGDNSDLNNDDDEGRSSYSRPSYSNISSSHRGHDHSFAGVRARTRTRTAGSVSVPVSVPELDDDGDFGDGDGEDGAVMLDQALAGDLENNYFAEPARKQTSEYEHDNPPCDVDTPRESFVHVAYEEEKDEQEPEPEPQITPLKTKPPGFKKELKSMFKKVFSSGHKTSSSKLADSVIDSDASGVSDMYGTPGTADATLYESEPVSASPAPMRMPGSGGGAAASGATSRVHQTAAAARRVARPVVTSRLHTSAHQQSGLVGGSSVPANLFSGGSDNAGTAAGGSGASSTGGASCAQPTFRQHAVQIPTPSATVIKQSQQSAVKPRVSASSASAAASTPAKRPPGKTSNGGAGGYQWGSSDSAAVSTAPIFRPTTTAAAATSASKNVASTLSPSLPAGWEEVKQAGGAPSYYYHKITRISRWDRPTETTATTASVPTTAATTAESAPNPNPADISTSADANACRRKEEKPRSADAQSALADELRADVQRALHIWMYPRGTTHARGVSGSALAPFTELLQSLPTLLPALLTESSSVSASASSFTLKTTASDGASDSAVASVKKLYMKAVRLIHPDKIPADTDMYTKMLAQEAFIVLSQQFETFRKQLQ